MSQRKIKYAVTPTTKPPCDADWREAEIGWRISLHAVAENIAKGVHGVEKTEGRYIVWIDDPDAYPAANRFIVDVALELKFKVRLMTRW